MCKVVIAFIGALAAWASPIHALTTNAPTHGLPSAADYSGTLLPEMAGVVSWKTLAQVEPVKRANKMVLEFAREVLGLDKQSVRIYGFMIPLDMGDQQKHFLLAAVPASCPFCMPAGPEAMVEVMSKAPVKFGYEPVLMSGKFAVLKEAEQGLLYRMTDAEPIRTELK